MKRKGREQTKRGPGRRLWRLEENGEKKGMKKNAGLRDNLGPKTVPVVQPTQRAREPPRIDTE